MRLKELSVELQDKIVSRHRSGQFCNIENPQEHSGLHLEPPRLFLELAARPNSEQSGEKGLCQGGDQGPDGHSDRAPENLPEGQPSLQHYTNQAFVVEWPNGSHSSVKKAHDSRLEFAKRHLKDSQNMRNKIQATVA